MTAFYELKPNKILSYTYTTYPSYEITFSGSGQDSYVSGVVTSSVFYLYENSPYVTGRNFYDEYGNYVQGAADYSGSVVWANSNIGALGLLSSSVALTYNQYLTACVHLLSTYKRNAMINPDFYGGWTGGTLSNFQIWEMFNIPSILYGTELKPGSVSLKSSPTGYPYIDNGYGSLYFSGTSPTSQNAFILYQHGIILVNVDSAGYFDTTFSLYFSGTHKISQNIYIIDIPKGDANFSTNPSYVNYDTGSRANRLAISEPKTYPTTIGMYNEDYELLAVIKLATPLYHDEKTPAQIRAKLNF